MPTLAQTLAQRREPAWLTRLAQASKTVGRGFESLRPCCLGEWKRFQTVSREGAQRAKARRYLPCAMATVPSRSRGGTWRGSMSP